MNERDTPGDIQPPQTDSGYVEALASPDDVLTLRGLLSQHEGAWVSFRKDLTLSLDGSYSNHVTPEAIYAIPVDKVLEAAADYVQLSRVRQRASYFHCIGYTRRPAAVVFRSHGRIVSTRHYVDFREDFERLLGYVSRQYPDAVATVEKWRPKREYDHYTGSRAVFWMAEKVTDVIVRSESFGNYEHHPDKPKVWRELMLAMDIDAYEDRNNFLTGDCPEQIAVFEPSSAEVVAAFDNPTASPKYSASASLRKG